MSTLTRTHPSSHTPQSLPSFAQAFSNINHHPGTSSSVANLAKISIARDSDQNVDMHTLPPIHRVERNISPDPDSAGKGKKRSLDSDVHDEHEDVKRAVKQEDSLSASHSHSHSPSPQMDVDQLEPSSSPPRRPAKKRRVTSTQAKPSPSADQPVSPGVATFTVPNNDKGALEQVRATLTLKQKQKEIIEQRRGSAAGLLQSTSAATTSPRPGPLVRRQSGNSLASAPTASSSQPHSSPKQQHTQPHHFSPPQQSLPAPNNSFSNSRRRRGTLQVNGHGAPDSPHPLVQPPRLPPSALTPTSTFPQPQPVQPQLLRTPAIAKSTTTRAAPPKPLTIAPHGHSRRLEPLVHSAPVIGGFGPVRVPELPPIPITPGGRRVSMGPGIGGGGGGGGGGANVAIAKSGGMRTAGIGLGLGRVSVGSTSTLTSGVGTVPPTPAYASLASQQQQPTAAQDGKAGFLQLFDNFYDSLADSRLLKQWLQEQLGKSNALLEQLRDSGGVSLTQVEELIERRVAPMKNEVEGLRRRVGELEEMLYRERQRGAPRRESSAVNPEVEDAGQRRASGVHDDAGRRASGRSEAGTYVFPESREEPGERERDRERERGSPAGSLHSSPSFDQRRLSTSAVRLEHSHVHPVFSLPSSSGQHRPSPLGQERDATRAWDRRRSGGESAGASHGSSARHDMERERPAPPPPPPSSQARAPSA